MSIPHDPAPDSETSPRQASYLQIIKGTAVVGGSSLVTLMLSLVRTKASAVWLGSEGVGLIGLFHSMLDITQAIAGLGIHASGVRQIAAAEGAGDRQRVSSTARALTRLSILLGIIGAGALALFALPLARLTFGDDRYAPAVTLLSLALFFRLVAAGQTGLLQGLRQIGSLARFNIAAACLTTAITVAWIYVLRLNGIVPAIVTSSAALMVVSYFYARKIPLRSHDEPHSQCRREFSPLIRLGVAFMLSGLLSFGASYVVRLIVLDKAGVAATGLYQAAWALGSLYAGFILQAMGTDFYPRLAAIAHDHPACNKLVNEQAFISLLLAGPGVLATLTFAPFVMWAFYSAEFLAAADMLRWICLGMLLRVLAWPMGYILMAKGVQGLFLLTEVAATVVHLGLAWLLVEHIGVTGAAVAFFGLYVWHSLLIMFIVAKLTGFRWSRTNLGVGILFLMLAAGTFVATQFLPLWPATVVGTFAVFVGLTFSLGRLIRILPADKVPAKLRDIRWPFLSASR